jgi:FkbM family methyltransferase
MKLTPGMLYHFVKLFGLKHGVTLFTNFRFNKLDHIKLPHLQSAFALRKGTSDVPLFDQIFVHPEYNMTFPITPKVIIDGGANIGLFTLLMKNKFPDAMVISVEPDKDNFGMLQKNVASYNNVICENCGLWNKEANLKVYDKYDSGKWAMVVEESKEDANIKAISIGAIMEKYALDRIDLVKLDIETSEKKVFLDNYECWLPKTKMLIVELHDWMEDGCSKPFFNAINKTFTNYKYLITGQNTIIINNDID